MKYTLSGRQQRTFMKLIVEAGTDRVVGAHMVGDDAAELIQGLAVAMKAGATKAHFDATVGIHPTAAGHSILATSMVALTMSVPEIDPAGCSSVVALVIGVLGLIERRRPTRARAPATHRSPAIPC